MRKFVFRLESALRWRARHREEEEAKLRKLFERRDTLAHEAEAMQRERSEIAKFVSEGVPADIRDLRALAGYTLGWQARDVNLRAAIEKNQVLIDEQWRRVIVAQQQEKIIINLREKQLEEWRLELDKKVQADAEEAWLALWDKGR